jgi:hypothetical protein
MDARTVRFIWNKATFHQIRPESKEHVVSPISEQDRNRLPAVLALPFLWNTSVEVLKTRYQVELLKEEAATCSLMITPISKRGPSSFSKAFLQFDHETYLPRRYLVWGHDGKTETDYRVTEVRYNQRRSVTTSGSLSTSLRSPKMKAGG